MLQTQTQSRKLAYTRTYNIIYLLIIIDKHMNSTYMYICVCQKPLCERRCVKLFSSRPDSAVYRIVCESCFIIHVL